VTTKTPQKTIDKQPFFSKTLVKTPLHRAKKMVFREKMVEAAGVEPV
jgi:hypothetical protein